MSTISAYEVSKMAFKELFINRNHMANQIVNLTHNTTASTKFADKETAWRLANDIQFLSMLESQARIKNDLVFAQSVLSELDLAIRSMGEQLDKETFHQKLFSPFTAQYLVALTFAKKFNNLELRNKGFTVAQGYVNKYLPVFLKSAVDSYTTGTAIWNEPLFGLGSGTITYEQLTKKKLGIIAENGIKRFAGSLNGYALIGGALSMYGALLSGTTPTTYEHRSKIVDLGNLCIDMSANGDDVLGHLNNIGGGREEGAYASTGYTSWVARGLAQMSTGTTFVFYNPNSMFMREARLIEKGLLTVLSRKGYMPDKFYDLDGSHANTIGGNLSGDKTIYLYELAWCGQQETIDTIEKHLAVNHGLGKCNPIIFDSLLSDEGGMLESNLHRAMAGLTGGMIKGLEFNYASKFI